MGLWENLSSAYRLYLRTIRVGKHPTLPRFRLGHQYTPLRCCGAAPEAAALEADDAAAKLVLSSPSVAELKDDALAAELAALAQMEQDEPAAFPESEEELAVGDSCFLGLDSP
jgi:hypothetical protein